MDELEAYELAIAALLVYGTSATSAVDRLLREVFGVDSLDRLDAPQALDEYKLAIEVDDMLSLTPKGTKQAEQLLELHHELRFALLCRRLLPTTGPDIYLGAY